MIDGLHFVRAAATKSRPVRWYVYAWRGGPRIMVSDGPKKPNLTKDALAALAEAHEDRKPIQDNMLAAAIRQCRGRPGEILTMSPEWRRLAKSTRDTWGLSLDAIEDKWGELPIALWDDPRMITEVVKWRDSRAGTPRAADMGVTVLAWLLDWCKLRAKVRLNVAADVPAIYTGADRAEIIWLDEDIAAFKASELGRNTPRQQFIDILELACLTGFRRGDLCAVTFDEVTDHAIVREALKKSRGRRRRAVVPLIPETKLLIERLRTRHRKEGVNTLLVNSRGDPWAPVTMTTSFIDARSEANDGKGIFEPGNPKLGVPDRAKHLHDCRGTFVTKLCRTDMTNEEIARVVAWSSENVDRIRRTYVDDAAVVVALSQRINRSL